MQPFIYRHNGTYKTLSLHRNGALLPTLDAIADNGAIGGSYYVRPGYSRAFVTRGHHIHVYDAPQGDQKLGDGTYLSGFGSHGTICGGIVARHHHDRGFILRNGHERVIDLHPSVRRAGTGILTCNSKGEFGGVAEPVHGKNQVGIVGHVR